MFPMRDSITLAKHLVRVLIAAVGCMFSVDVSQADANTQLQELVFLTWSEYIDPEVVNEFEKTFRVKVKFGYYESDDARSKMLVANDGRGYDLALVSGLDVNKYLKHGWLAPVSVANVPNLKHIDDRWAGAFPGARSHAVPYFWGTLGIAYRADLLAHPITSWSQLLNPPEALSGRIVMHNYSRDLIGIALKALGYSLNSNDRQKIKQAENLLQAQRPYVKDYAYITLDEQSALVTGDAWVSMIYNGDALMAQEHHKGIEYILPEEGSNIWVDYLAILASSQRKTLAATFINFLNEPRIAARNAEFVYYATPNKAAEQYLPADYFDHPVIYPSAAQLSRSEFYKPLSPRAQRLINNIMVRFLNQPVLGQH